MTQVQCVVAVVTLVVEDEGAEAVHELRVGDDDAHCAGVAPEQRQLAVVVAARRHRLAGAAAAAAVTHHRDLETHVRTQRTCKFTQWRNDGVAAASSDGGLTDGRGPRQVYFILNQRGRALT